MLTDLIDFICSLLLADPAEFSLESALSAANLDGLEQA